METQSSQARILIVDDTLVNLQLLANILSQANYEVHTASNGAGALVAAGLNRPDLILLDIMMPEMDGYEVCARLKADPQMQDIPVIFISALSEPLDKVKAFSVGGIDYITKPFQLAEVLARVRTHLALRELQVRLQAANAQLLAQNQELQEALATIKTLSGLIPICAWCGNKIQDEDGEWVKVEAYIEARSEAMFTHGICPECLKKLRP
jgi:PleD family two-component response regulator